MQLDLLVKTRSKALRNGKGIVMLVLVHIFQMVQAITFLFLQSTQLNANVGVLLQMKNR